MIIALLDMFSIDKVHGVGWCGGGATLYRTIA